MQKPNRTPLQKIGRKFTRRHDLNSAKRLYIATTALFAMLNRQWVQYLLWQSNIMFHGHLSMP